MKKKWLALAEAAAAGLLAAAALGLVNRAAHFQGWGSSALCGVLGMGAAVAALLLLTRRSASEPPEAAR